MLIDNLRQVYFANKDKNPALLRNLLKESLQFYILDFVVNSAWGKRLVLRGGTCLRFCFGLPRLSEDLDFDVEDWGFFDISKFNLDISNYFAKKLQYSKLVTKISGSKRIIYLKFPILKDLGAKAEGDTNTIHVRLDFAPVPTVAYKVDVSIKSTPNFSLVIRRYSLEDLMAGKISAIINREAFEGESKVERFKGRDFYDLVWFLEKGVSPNWKFVEKVTKLSKNEAFSRLIKRVKTVTPKFLKQDLLPFIEDWASVKSFADNFQSSVNQNIQKIG